MKQATVIKQLLDSFVNLPRPSAEELEMSKPFEDLAQQVATRAPDSHDTVLAIRNLLDARNAALRAAFPETVQQAAQRGFHGRCPEVIKGEQCALTAGHEGGHKWANGD